MSLGEEEIRNRFAFHQGTGVTISRHERVRNAYLAIAEFLDDVLGPCDPRAVKLAFDRLQESSMWANFAISEQAPLQVKKSYDSKNPRPTPMTMKIGPKPPA